MPPEPVPWEPVPQELVLDRPDGARLALRVLPAAGRRRATVVLAHGWTMTGASWRPVVERLRAARPDVAVVTYDQRDHGASRPAPGRPRASVRALADDLAAVVERAAADGPVVLGGHSMGGMTVLALAGSRPDLVRDRVAGLLLVNTAAGGLRGHRPTAAVMRALAAAPPRVRVPRVPAPLARRLGYGRGAPPDVVARVRDGVRAPTARSVGSWYLALLELDETDSLRHLVDVPVAVLAGESDRLTPAGFARRIAAELPAAGLEVVPGAGHMLPFERPGLVAARLLSLLPGPR